MYFADLTPYEYGRLSWSSRRSALNIGWLGPSHEFSTAKASREFLSRLWHYCQTKVQQTRGLYDCHICGRETRYHEFEGRVLELGSAEIRVFSTDGTAYAAPNLIFHYVAAHQYDPPDVFKQAVLTGPLPGSKRYAALLYSTGSHSRDADSADAWVDPEASPYRYTLDDDSEP